jgi:hypothetical protein
LRGRSATLSLKNLSPHPSRAQRFVCNSLMISNPVDVMTRPQSVSRVETHTKKNEVDMIGADLTKHLPLNIETQIDNSEVVSEECEGVRMIGFRDIADDHSHLPDANTEG